MTATAITPISATYRRDGNYIPITTDGITIVDSQTLVGSGATVAVPIFSITGSVEIRAIYGVVTTTLGNNTAAYFRVNDATAQSSITLSTGTSLTSAGVGSMIVKKDLASAAVTLLTAAQERVSEPTTLETTFFSPFVVVQKNAVTTNIEFVYTTSDTPTTGALQFFVRFLPLSNGANIVAL